MKRPHLRTYHIILLVALIPLVYFVGIPLYKDFTFSSKCKEVHKAVLSKKVTLPKGVNINASKNTLEFEFVSKRTNQFLKKMGVSNEEINNIKPFFILNEDIKKKGAMITLWMVLTDKGLDGLDTIHFRIKISGKKMAIASIEGVNTKNPKVKTGFKDVLYKTSPVPISNLTDFEQNASKWLYKELIKKIHSNP